MRIFVFFAVILVFSLAVSAVMPVTSYKSNIEVTKRLGVERVTHYDPRVNFARIDTIAYLGPLDSKRGVGVGRGGYSPIYPRATAKITSSAWYGFPRAQVKIATKDIVPSGSNTLFEAWLVDKDSGQRLSLGTFTAALGGIGKLSYNVDNYFDAYDFVEITEEPFDDLDVLPGKTILVGAIPAPKFFDPAPKSAKMVTQVFSSY